MATTLAYSRVRPATDDPQSTWMTALENNVTIDDAHDHDGTDSALIPASSITRFSSTISSGSWSGSAGVYTQTVTVPTGISGAATYNDINNYNVAFYITSSGTRIYPSMVRASSTTYTLTVNDNSLALTAIYS